MIIILKDVVILMNLKQIEQELKTEKYNFLRTNPNLGDNIILLGLGGSHAYGTNTESSDLDIRGCALNSRQQILTNQNFEQVVNEETDTTIYSFNKLISLLSDCNPNTIELLGLKPEHYLYLHPIGRELLDNADMFLSKKCIKTFGGYANQQLYRLKQLTKHGLEHDELEQHILKTLQMVMDNFDDRYSGVPTDFIKLYIDKSDHEDYNTEIFIDASLSHYPLRDYCGLWNELQSIVKSYRKLGKRNKHALEHSKISKHMCHLVRLYMMCIDLLDKHQVITYRENEHDLLMSIRNGEYVTEDNQVKDEFYEILNEYERKFDEAKAHTTLPDKPDYKRINEFMMEVNSNIICCGIY